MFNFQGHAQVLNVLHFCSPLSQIFSEERCSSLLLFRIVIIFLCSTYLRGFFFFFFFSEVLNTLLSFLIMFTQHAHQEIGRKMEVSRRKPSKLHSLRTVLVFAAIFSTIFSYNKEEFLFFFFLSKVVFSFNSISPPRELLKNILNVFHARLPIII